ncbi:MAG: hypothetical protein JW982_15775 [Spirochaetes bacterium]|nr:hypothetical protein [Spirochaetota bacterium]
MAAVQSGSFNMVFGDVILYVDREKLEMYPGVNTELITIDYEYNTENEAGFCVEKNPYF